MLAHARRKFKEADIAQSKGKPKAGKATWAMSHIKKLYRIERLIKDKTPVEKHVYREEHATPLLEEYKTWLDKSIQQVPPKPTLGKALAYSLNQWQSLLNISKTASLISITTVLKEPSNP